jgi:hypothetical protein
MGDDDGETTFPKPKRSRAWIAWLMAVAVAFGVGYGIGRPGRSPCPVQPLESIAASLWETA